MTRLRSLTCRWLSSERQVALHITAHLGGGPVKETDLVIRPGGEHRLSGFSRG